MQDGRQVEPADRSTRDPADQLAPTPSGDRWLGREGSLAAPAVAILAVLCCAGPLLFAALITTGGGAWLGAHGYTLAAAALTVAAAILAWRITIRMSRG